MSPLVPAVVGGLPGAPELLVILIIGFLLFGVPVSLAVLVGYKYISGKAEQREREERLTELERELADLRDRLDDGTHSTPESRDTATDTEPQAESGPTPEGTANDE